MVAKSERIRFTILCEGRRDYYFTKAVIQTKMGKNRTEFFRSQTVSGRGSGEQQVRRRFVMELEARRKRPRLENHWLVVVTDGDGLSVEQRKATLYKEVTQKGLDPPLPNERVAIFVPCRNIESWVQWVETDEVDETQNFKHEFHHAR